MSFYNKMLLVICKNSLYVYDNCGTYIIQHRTILIILLLIIETIINSQMFSTGEEALHCIKIARTKCFVTSTVTKAM